MMTGVVVVTHGSAACRHAGGGGAKKLLGTEPPGFAALEVGVGENRGEIVARLNVAVASVSKGGGVLVLCGLHGSTLSNCAVEMAQVPGSKMVVASGVNLPMLVKLATLPREDTSAEELAGLAVETAVRSIRVEARGK